MLSNNNTIYLGIVVIVLVAFGKKTLNKQLMCNYNDNLNVTDVFDVKLLAIIRSVIKQLALI